MSDQPIISVSGLRGIVGRSLTPLVACRYVAAFSAELGPGPLVVTRDGRASGRMLADIVGSTLVAAGRRVVDADVAATPTTGVLIRELGGAGGVQISASHNPPEYNGLKLFGSDGRVVPAPVGENVLRRYESPDAEWAPHNGIGCRESHRTPHASHLRFVLDTVDVERIKIRRFNVLLDSNHGAGGLMGDDLLRALGCHAVLVGKEPNGQFKHTPEPTAKNLADVCRQIQAAGVDVGFCQDPDADRLAIVDGKGNYIGEEYTVALCLNHVLAQTVGPVVTNCSTSKMVEDVARNHNAPFFHSKVGEANVADEMIKREAVFGGEGNGGPIDPRVGYVRDSFVGMALVLDAMAKRDLSLAELAAELPRYEIVKTTVSLASDMVQDGLAALEHHFKSAKNSRLDGLRLDWADKWLLVRASNTEPIVRLVAEAKSEAVARQLCDESAKILAKLGN